AEVADPSGAGTTLAEDRPKTLRLPRRRAPVGARGNWHGGAAAAGSPPRLFSDLGRSEGDRRALLARRQRARKGRRDDAFRRPPPLGGREGRGRHTGMLPCLRQGRSSFLERACSRAWTMTRRVSAGSI